MAQACNIVMWCGTASAMYAIRKCCSCCYPRLWTKKVDDGNDVISETTVLGREELDLEDPTPRETQSQTYRCEIVPPEAVVQEGSMVHGFYLPPWEVDFQNFKRFLELQQQNPVSLSKMQKAALRDWCSMSKWLERQGHENEEPVIFEGMPQASKIRQGRVTDCSLMSVLSVLADYDCRCGRSTLQMIVQGRVSKDTGKDTNDYACCLFVNGIFRCVLVDDLVPVGTSGKLLCAHSASARELWVMLIEKAVAKIMGGSYAMRGSNPSTDAFHLTGWIPETFPLKDEESLCTSQADWMRIFDTAQQGFAKGQCVICIGTTELPDAMTNELALRSGYSEGVSSSTGLVAGHAYPVLQCCLEEGQRLLYVKNPWGHTRWKGRYAPGDLVWTSNPILASKLGYNSQAAASIDDGAFWIPWEEVLRYFSHFYISWSPSALGLTQLQAHGCWNPWPHFVQSILPDDTDLLAFNPQFHLQLLEPLPSNDAIGIWVVLSRHIKSPTDYNSHFVSVSIYNGKSRICCPNSVLEQGVFSNGECALVKLRNDASGSQQDFTVVVSQHGAKRAFNYTVQVYTKVPAVLQDLPPLVPNSYASGAVRGEWTRRTSGGCSNSVWSFFQNPQWSFTVPPEGLQELIFFLECQDVSVNLRLFSDAVARPEALRFATSSGAYRRGCCMLRLTDLEPKASHVLVVSTFRPGVCGSYRLAWHASSSVTLSPQPHPFVEGALAHPLKSVVQPMQIGTMVEMQLRIVDHNASLTGQACRVSMRLQGTYEGGELPYLELSSAHPSRQAPYCVRLKVSDADQYFQLSGASVILFAQLKPMENYVLRAKVPRSRGARNAKLYINSDRLVVVDNLTSPRARRR